MSGVGGAVDFGHVERVPAKLLRNIQYTTLTDCGKLRAITDEHDGCAGLHLHHAQTRQARHILRGGIIHLLAAHTLVPNRT